MRTLVERCFNSINLAKRWASYIGEVRRLRKQAEQYEQLIKQQHVSYDSCSRELRRTTDLLLVAQAARRELPKDVVALLETAQSLMELTARGAPQPSYEYRIWLGEYRFYRLGNQRGTPGGRYT